MILFKKIFLTYAAIVIYLPFFFIGCATNPNKPYAGKMPTDFIQLEQQNPLLAVEIKKLPELNDGVSIEEVVMATEN